MTIFDQAATNREFPWRQNCMDEAEPVADEEDFAESFSFLADTRSCLASPELRRSMRTVRTWVLTLAVIGCCWFALMSLVAVGGMFMSRRAGPVEMLTVALILMVFLVIGGLPIFMMFQFASHSRRFISTARLQDFVSTLQSQRRMWNIFGIYGILAIVMNLVALGLMALGYVS